MYNSPQKAIHDSFTALMTWMHIVFLGSFLVAIIAFGVVRHAPSVYENHFSYIVSPGEREEAPGFRYDGYYAISGTELFSTTLASLITSPEIIVRAYELANIILPTQDPTRLTKHIRAEKTASQLVQVTVSDSSKEGAERLAEGVRQAVIDAVRGYNEKNTPSIAFTAISTEAWTGNVQFAAFPIALVSGVFVFVVMCMGILFFQALKRGED